MKKVIISLILFLLFSSPAYAEEVICGYDYKVNPLYEYLNIEYAQLYDRNSDSTAYEDCTDFEDAHNYIIEQAMLRDNSISFCYPTDLSIFLSHEEKDATILSDALALFESMGDYSEFDKNGAASDYIYHQWFNRKISYGYAIDYSKRIVYACITFNIVWFTTPQQAQEETAKVTEILDELDVYDKDEYTQIKAVYDYLMDNAEYVKNYKEKEEEGTNLIYHSSYSALVMGETVCQGYATALYRLLRELGVSCRIISGTGNGQPHAWNMVRIGSYYYLVDATWDDNYLRQYRYFLKSSYSDHTNYSEFNETEFKRYFPMAEAEYTEPLEYIPNAPANITIVRDGDNVNISFDLDYTAQYACVKKDGEFVYLTENPLEDKTTHTYTDVVGNEEITYEISALRAEYNSRTEEETHHFNTVEHIFQKTITFTVEKSEENAVTVKINHNDTSKEGKMLVMVVRAGVADTPLVYDPQEKIEFTCEDFNENCNIKAMWIESLSTMKPLCVNENFNL